MAKKSEDKPKSEEDSARLRDLRKYLEESEASNRGMSDGMKIAIGTLITGALLYFGYKNFGSPVQPRDYMRSQQIQSQTAQSQGQRQVPTYVVVNPNLPQNNSNGFSVIDTHTRTKNEFRRGGKYNYAGSSTNHSQTTHTIVPNTPVYAAPQQTRINNYPRPCDKEKLPEPCERELPPKPVPQPDNYPLRTSLENQVEVVPTPSPLEEKTQAREY